MNSMNSENISTFTFVQEMTEKDDSLSLIYMQIFISPNLRFSFSLFSSEYEYINGR